MSNCHASASKPTWLEDAIITTLFYATPPALAVVVLWLIVSLMGWQLALPAGIGMVAVEYRRELTALLPLRTEYHQLLGVSRFATRRQIDQAYRRAIQHSHPDRGGNFLTAVKLNEARAELMGRKHHG